MSTDKPMECPECGEDAVSQPATDLVPWEAHGLARPQWSHRDGSSLCPVIGRSGGYEPAQPQPKPSDRAADTARLDPPASMGPGVWDRAARPGQLRGNEGQLSDGPAEPAGNLRAGRQPYADVGTVGVGREHMRSVVARLYPPGPQARAELSAREPEAGA